MKTKLLLIIAIALCCYSCKKEQIIVVGQSYHIKGDIFNKGVYQPKQPVRVDSLYTDPISGYPYAVITDMDNVKWFIPTKDLK